MAEILKPMDVFAANFRQSRYCEIAANRKQEIPHNRLNLEANDGYRKVARSCGKSLLGTGPLRAPFRVKQKFGKYLKRA
jgi:hypothetical protein